VHRPPSLKASKREALRGFRSPLPRWGCNQSVGVLVCSLVTLKRGNSPWPLIAIHVGASMFIIALGASVFFDQSIWLLHGLQALIYVAVMVLAQRNSPWGFGAGFLIAVLWNGANLFATGFIDSALHALLTSLSTGHIVRPVLLLVLVGAAGHFLMIAGCVAGIIRSGGGRRQWAQFLGGAILGMIALVLIAPLRSRLHEQPLPLDVAPAHDILGAYERSSTSTRQRTSI
jgi:hypothetical protein